VTFLTLGSQIGRAFGWVGVGYSVPQIWHPLAFLLATAVLMLAGVTLTAPLVIALVTALGALAVMGQGLVYLKRLAPGVRKSVPEFHRTLWLRVALPLLVIDGFNALINYTDVLMIGAYRDPASVGFYFAAARIATLVTFFFQSVGALTGPKLAELHAQGNVVEMQKLLRSIAPWIALPAAAMTLLITVTGPFLLGIFGAGFEVAWLALVFLSIGNLVTSITGPAALLLNMTGHQDTTAKVYAATAIANGVLNFVLVPRYGITGAAAATAISTGTISSLLFLFVRRKLGISTSILLAR
jgi:O-antigen/teichoic acid export membrane protein